MANQTTDQITKHDLDRIEASIQRVIQVAETQNSSSDVKEILKNISSTLHQLKTKVEFDHEKRLSAIEDFLQNL